MLRSAVPPNLPPDGGPFSSSDKLSPCNGGPRSPYWPSGVQVSAPECSSRGLFGAEFPLSSAHWPGTSAVLFSLIASAVHLRPSRFYPAPVGAEAGCSRLRRAGTAKEMGGKNRQGRCGSHHSALADERIIAAGRPAVKRKFFRGRAYFPPRPGSPPAALPLTRRPDSRFSALPPGRIRPPSTHGPCRSATIPSGGSPPSNPPG